MAVIVKTCTSCVTKSAFPDGHPATACPLCGTSYDGSAPKQPPPSPSSSSNRSQAQNLIRGRRGLVVTETDRTFLKGAAIVF